MEIPRIRVDEVDDICVLVCYLIYSLGCPLSKTQLIEITSYEDAVNYFDLIDALDKVSGHLCAEEEIDGEIYYSNTANGINAARNLGSTLPFTIRDNLFKEAVRVYTRDAMKKKGSFFGIRYIKNSDGTCTVGITITDEESLRQKYYLEINTENEERADSIKQKIKSDPKAFSEYLDDFFDL